MSVLHHIDEPISWNTPAPLIIVRGWCFDLGGDNVVGIEIIGAGDPVVAPVGLSRPDVAAAFGQRPGSATSGFCLVLPRPTSGPLRAVFRAIHRDGARSELRTVVLGAEERAGSSEAATKV